MKSVSASQRVLSLVSWLLSLFSFGLRWCAYWVTGLVRMGMGRLFRPSKNVYRDGNEPPRYWEPELKKIFSEAVSSLSSEELLKLQDEAMQKRRTVHYPPRGNE